MQNGGLFKAGGGKYLMSASIDARHMVTQDLRIIAAFEESFKTIAQYATSLKSNEAAQHFFNPADKVFS
jgi:hypothetical protein